MRAVRAIRVERRIACARSALTRTRPKGPVRPLPSCARERWLASCHLAVKTSAGEGICYMSPLPNLFGRGRAEPSATARVRAVRAIHVEHRVTCARSTLTRTRPKGPVRPLPSFARERWLVSCHLSQTSFGRGRAEPSAIARVRAVRAIHAERCVACSRSIVHRAHPTTFLYTCPSFSSIRSGRPLLT